MKGWVFLYILVLLSISVPSLVSANCVPVDGCTCFPACTEPTIEVGCYLQQQDTACSGGCEVIGSLIWNGACPEGETQTTSVGCPSGQVKDQTCGVTTCGWDDTSSCYYPTGDDADGDGVLNQNDDCPNVAASSPTNCNGCPNPTCSGCLTWPSSCPSSGPRLCTEGDDTQCTQTSCVDGCIGNQWCSYDGAPYCERLTGTHAF